MIPSPESVIRDDLAQLLEIEKWGWVIYHCTYGDDTTWAKFRDRVEAHSRESITQSDAPETAERLEWTWVEDASALDGASTAALRERFCAWTADEVARQPGNYQPTAIPRFRYFIKIDKEVLDSLLEYISRETYSSDDAFVKFVDGIGSRWLTASKMKSKRMMGGKKRFWSRLRVARKKMSDGCASRLT